jgi:hypothetical protein
VRPEKVDAPSTTKVKDGRAATLETPNTKKVLKRVIAQDMTSEENVPDATVRNPDTKKHRRCDGQNKNDRRNKQ